MMMFELSLNAGDTVKHSGAFQSRKKTKYPYLKTNLSYNVRSKVDRQEVKIKME